MRHAYLLADHAHSTQPGLSMSCFGSVLSYLFGRNELVNGHNYRVVKRIGEGGTYRLVSWIVQDEYYYVIICLGFQDFLTSIW